MNIITWNVNRFDGTWDWYAKECDLEQEKRTLFINNIIEKIGEFIVTENDIAVLQEVPYKETIDLNEKFKRSGMELKSWYIEDDSNIINEDERNKFRIPNNLTVAVVRKESSWKLTEFDKRICDYGETDGKYNYVNRYVELENTQSDVFKPISFFGGHFDMGKSMWKQITNVKQERFSFIAADFNFNELKTKPDDENLYKKIRESGYTQMIANDVITCNQRLSSIDNIFMLNSFKNHKDSGIKVSVLDYCFCKDNNENVRFSDHNMCLLEYKNKII